MNDNYQIDENRWKTFSLKEQFGNIAVDVHRAINAKKRNDQDRQNMAVTRVITLLNATAEAVKTTPQKYRLKEILRARNEFVRLFYEQTFNENADLILQYFLAFATASRAGR